MGWLFAVLTFVIGFGLGSFYFFIYKSSNFVYRNYSNNLFCSRNRVKRFAFWKLISKEIKLEFGKITKDNNKCYFIRVQQKGGKGKGKAINAESRLSVECIDYDYAPSVWANGRKKIVDIGEHEDLFLYHYKITLQLFYHQHMMRKILFQIHLIITKFHKEI